MAFDSDITFEQIELDTELYKEDHLSDFLSRNGSFTKSYAYPMEPTTNDTEDMTSYFA